MHIMSWDDLRFVLAVAQAGSLLGAGRRLGVDHTTVGRRVEAAESTLGLKLFTRTRSGYVLTADAERLLPALSEVERAVLQVERHADAQQEGLEGAVRVTSPETLGTHYLAARLATFGRDHPQLQIALVPAGEVLDLGRRQAELAIRTFRSKKDNLVVRRVAVIHYAFYASAEYLQRHPLRSPAELSRHTVLCGPPEPGEVEAQWLSRLAPDVRPQFVSVLSSALLEAARAGAGVTILPCYLGDPEPTLTAIDMPKPPTTKLYLTVHEDLRKTPRVRALMDFITARMKQDAPLFAGS